MGTDTELGRPFHVHTMPVATVLITTKNRKEELRAAIASALTQSVAVEVLVVDDGSTDGTAEMVRAEFPQARLERFEQSGGYITRRNLGAEMASTPYVFSIDDDAAFPSRFTVEQTLAEFSHPRIGAVAIPFINVRQNPAVLQKAPDTAKIWLTQSYIGTAHALRRDVFLKLGGYRPYLIHQGEEGDFCSRLLDAGYVVRLGNADPIHHFESPRRDFRRMDFYGRRNDILYVWHNVPWPNFPVHLLAVTAHGVNFALRCGRPWHHFKGLIAGYAACFSYWSKRRPVSRAAYGLTRRLRKSGPISLDELEPLLPPLR